MSEEIFEQALTRAVEFREQTIEVTEVAPLISLCGLGEPLLNPKIATYVARVREEGFKTSMSSNGALLDERRATAVLDAGLQQVMLNIGDLDDDYEDVYKLPFEKTRDNILRFKEMAEGRCAVWIVLVDYRSDKKHVAAMKDYWRGFGIDLFGEFEIMNRGGALFVDHMQFEALPQLASAREMLQAEAGGAYCAAPFAFPFIGYDGKYYLCCSDWKKEVEFGNVFERSILELTEEKLRHVTARAEVCRTCNLDPLNRLVDEMRAIDEGEDDTVDLDELVDSLRGHTTAHTELLERLQPGVMEAALQRPKPGRRLIPVTSL